MLTSQQLRKGTGDVLRDLDEAARLTDTSEPGFGQVVCSGLQLDFVNRALRVAAGEIRQLQSRIATRKQKPQETTIMGQAFDRYGNVIGEATGASFREVLDKLQTAHPDAHAIRVEHRDDTRREDASERDSGKLSRPPCPQCQRTSNVRLVAAAADAEAPRDVWECSACGRTFVEQTT